MSNTATAEPPATASDASEAPEVIEETGGDKPRYRVRIGHVEVSIWLTEQETDSGQKWTSHRASITRSYRDKKGDYQRTGSLPGEDWLDAAAAFQEANRQLRSTFANVPKSKAK